jgi:hypothetical protein
MSIIEMTPEQPNRAAGTVCEDCSGPTRLIGIEPHPTRAHTDLRTFQCLICDAVQAKVMPLAH